MNHGPITFPDWKEELGRAELGPQLKVAFAREIYSFLKHCKASRASATAALAKQYLEQRERATTAPARVAAAQEALDSEVAASVGGTANIGELIHEGLGWVDTLDAIMHNKYARSPEPLRAWESASHTERAPQRAKAAPAAVPTGATPASH